MAASFLLWSQHGAAPFLLHAIPTFSDGGADHFQTAHNENRRAKRAVRRHRAATFEGLEGQVVETRADAHDADGGRRSSFARGTERALSYEPNLAV
jgi:hypothetical protein